MGNCMDTCLPKQAQVQDDHEEVLETASSKTYPQAKRREDEEDEGFGEEEKGLAGGGNGKKGVRVKIVLTKEELQWLMAQLKSDGEKRLENMLEEIERGRRKAVVVCEGGSCNGWKPSLESIMEAPECAEMEMRL